MTPCEEGTVDKTRAPRPVNSYRALPHRPIVPGKASLHVLQADWPF